MPAENSCDMSDPALPVGDGFSAGLRARLDRVEALGDPLREPPGDPGPISPELVLVDPELSAIAREHLPDSAPWRPRSADVVPLGQRPEPPPAERRHQLASVLALPAVLGVVVTSLLILRAVYPPLRPHLEPADAGASSGLVNVGAEQHVVPHLPRFQLSQGQRAR
jgi:hypothetical protein